MFENKFIPKNDAIPQGWYGTDWAGSETHQEIRRDLTTTEIAELNAQNQIAEQDAVEAKNKSRRAQYLDAYRKYQASVNYGEFERVPAVDGFIECLRNKDWSAFNYVPPQIKYFAGEIGLTASGLVRH